MKSSKLSAEEARELLHYDPETGALTWKVNKGRSRAGGVAGHAQPDGYRRMVVCQGRYWAHRLIWLMVHGDWPKGVVDHINGDPSDNRLHNLRDVSREVNQQNQRRAPKRSATGVLGAKTHNDKFRADITVKGCRRHLGVFDTPEAAHQAYVNAKRTLHPGCTI